MSRILKLIKYLKCAIFFSAFIVKAYWDHCSLLRLYVWTIAWINTYRTFIYWYYLSTPHFVGNNFLIWCHSCIINSLSHLALRIIKTILSLRIIDFYFSDLWLWLTLNTNESQICALKTCLKTRPLIYLDLVMIFLNVSQLVDCTVTISFLIG